AIFFLKVGCVRVTHPCAGRQRSEDPVTPRLACIRPPASVHPEPGSNSPLSKILTALNTTNHLSNQQHHKPKCLFRILYPLKQTNVHSLSSLTRLSVSKNFMIMDQKKAHTISNFYPPARHFTSIFSQRDCKDNGPNDFPKLFFKKNGKKLTALITLPKQCTHGAMNIRKKV